MPEVREPEGVYEAGARGQKGIGGGRMRVCLLSRFFDLRNAGIGRYSMELMRGLRERGLEVRTVSQDGGCL